MILATGVAFFVMLWAADTLTLYGLFPVLAGRTLPLWAAAAIAVPATAAIQWITYKWIGRITR